MRKLADFTAAGTIILVAIFLLLPVLAVAALARESVVIADPSPWAQLWIDLQAPLAAFLMAVLTLLGAVVTYYARKIGGAKGEAIANGAYQILLDQAAGWLLAERKDGKDVTVDDAVSYIRNSYPEVTVHEPSMAKLGDDIIGAIGRMMAK